MAKSKTIAALIAIIVIIPAVMLLGCVEKETPVLLLHHRQQLHRYWIQMVMDGMMNKRKLQGQTHIKRIQMVMVTGILMILIL